MKTTERLLRIRGGYASRDGRFYVKRLKLVGWYVQDALPRQLLQTGVRTLNDARRWMQRRRRAYK